VEGLLIRVEYIGVSPARRAKQHLYMYTSLAAWLCV